MLQSIPLWLSQYHAVRFRATVACNKHEGVRVSPPLTPSFSPSEDVLYTYGFYLGLAFQIADDVLDFTGGSLDALQPPASGCCHDIPLVASARNSHGSRLFPSAIFVEAILYTDNIGNLQCSSSLNLWWYLISTTISGCMFVVLCGTKVNRLRAQCPWWNWNSPLYLLLPHVVQMFGSLGGLKND